MSIDKQNAWSYRRGRPGIALEYAFWRGAAAPDLATHFHADAQLTIVLSGRRAFDVGSARVTVLAGQCLYIPAKSPHRSLPLFCEGTRCLNIYAAIGGVGRSPIVIDVPELAGEDDNVDRAMLLSMIAPRLQDDGRRGQQENDAPPWLGILPGGSEAIGDIAARIGLSREGFSRKFARDVGMAPHAWCIVNRLNEARRRLRQGDSIAGLAAELDFADQSHFGRQFRRVFGITPRAYREGMR
ncbi:AraC family transcriptional regulator [Methylocapsa sp. S129]|uniref:helix-turn-helix domain-containing protein n=1 Tax=Methylocapsa sp. S129 TaxID=1641869 RepID=UPI00131E39D7|nr:helix-turn-helix domain-containing protein [Methylocapsa sp. S129]